MRNATVTLTATDVHAAHVALDGLVSIAHPVTFEVAKRDDRDSVSTRTGVLVALQGDSMMSNASARILTDQGERTYNLYLMSDVRPATLDESVTLFN